MCGIFGYVGSSRVDLGEHILQGLKILEYRGYDSWGVAVVPEKKSDRIFVQKQVGKIGDAVISSAPAGRVGFGHTRWATHGGVTQQNAHPHLDCTGRIAVVHNGIVENFSELKASLVKRGHTFVSETDSEVVAHLIEEEMAESNDLLAGVRQVFAKLEGMNALIVGQTGSDRLIAIKNGSPLVLGFGKGSNWLASDASAIATHTKQVYFLGDGEVADLTASQVTVFDVETGQEKPFLPQEITWSTADAELGNFPHFMFKEIHDQVSILRQLAERADTELEQAAEVLALAKELYAIACGSAAHVGIASQYIFSDIAKLRLQTLFGSEAMSAVPLMSEKSTVIAFSQSGETMDTLEPVKAAQVLGATALAIVNVEGSTLYRTADHSLLLHAGPEKAVASTKAVTAKLAQVLRLAGSIAGRSTEVQQDIAKAAAAIEALLEPTSLKQLRKVAQQLQGKRDIFVVGRGVHFPAALETALKIKEISYVHAEGMAGGELKHGTLALIEPGVPCLVYLPSDETRSAMISGAMELKARGAWVLGIGAEPSEVCDTFIQVADAGIARVIPHLVVGQVLAYYLATELGLDPDKPRNLAKSVTVK